jgi:hypothetical protein
VGSGGLICAEVTKDAEAVQAFDGQAVIDVPVGCPVNYDAAFTSCCEPDRACTVTQSIDCMDECGQYDYVFTMTCLNGQWITNYVDPAGIDPICCEAPAEDLCPTIIGGVYVALEPTTCVFFEGPCYDELTFAADGTVGWHHDDVTESLQYTCFQNVITLPQRDYSGVINPDTGTITINGVEYQLDT